MQEKNKINFKIQSNVRKYMIQNNLTIGKLTELSQIPRTSLSRVIAKNSDVESFNIAYAFRLAKILNTSVENLFNYIEEFDSTDNEQKDRQQLEELFLTTLLEYVNEVVGSKGLKIKLTQRLSDAWTPNVILSFADHYIRYGVLAITTKQLVSRTFPQRLTIISDLIWGSRKRDIDYVLNHKDHFSSCCSEFISNNQIEFNGLIFNRIYKATHNSDYQLISRFRLKTESDIVDFLEKLKSSLLKEDTKNYLAFSLRHVQANIVNSESIDRSIEKIIQIISLLASINCIDLIK